MRRALVVLLGLGLAAEGAAGRPVPPGGAGGPPAPPIDDHTFDRWEYSNGVVTCKHFDPERPTRGMCDRPEVEHAQVPEGSEVGGDPGQ